MFNKRTLFAVVLAIIVSLAILPYGTAFANYQDGTYDVPYEMKEANSDNTSIADGYFESPAKVTVNGDQATVQFTVTSADMVQSISVPGSSINVVGESGDTRTYNFTTSISNLESPITMDMHIIVPDLPELPGGYDREHQARAVFDVSGIPAGGEESDDNDEKNADEKETPAAEDNPPTGDNSQIMLYGLLLVGSAVALIVVRKLRPARN